MNTITIYFENGFVVHETKTGKVVDGGHWLADDSCEPLGNISRKR